MEKKWKTWRKKIWKHKMMNLLQVINESQCDWRGLKVHLLTWMFSKLGKNLG